MFEIVCQWLVYAIYVYRRYFDKKRILPQNLIKLLEEMTVNHLFCKKAFFKYKYEIIKKIFKENN